jgi:hypothetical protein
MLDGFGIAAAEAGSYAVRWAAEAGLVAAARPIRQVLGAVRFAIVYPVGCATYFVVTGPAAIKQTLTAAEMAGQVQAYPNTLVPGGRTDAMFWNVDPNCPPSTAPPHGQGIAVRPSTDRGGARAADQRRTAVAPG